MVRNKVVLPHPEGPSSATVEPAATRSDTERRTGWVPKDLDTSTTSMGAVDAAATTSPELFSTPNTLATMAAAPQGRWSRTHRTMGRGGSVAFRRCEG